MILQPDAIRWFKPAKDQVQIFYRIGSIPQPYVPDFVAETESDEVMIETKARNEMAAPEVMAKRQVAEEWCVSASAHAATTGGSPGDTRLFRTTSSLTI